MPSRIAELLSQHKGVLEALIIPAIVLLVGLSAFGLGRLSAVQGGGGGQLLIRLPDDTTQTAATYQAANQAAGKAAPVGASSSNTAGTLVASKSGTKYYLPSCSGASRIKEENKVWFASASQAQAAGYEPAANCPGI